jgi:acyl carrier protein
MIDDRFRRILARVKKCEDSVINLTASTDIVNDIGLDSLEVTEFLYSIEDEFEIEIDYALLEPAHLRHYNTLKNVLFGYRDVEHP